MSEYVSAHDGGRTVREHRLIVERILGRRLRREQCVHHADGDGTNNAKSNLVVCPSTEYHHLLHRRMKSLEKCGTPDNLQCKFCKRWDVPSNLYVHYDSGHQKVTSMHRDCSAKYAREWRAKQRKGV